MIVLKSNIDKSVNFIEENLAGFIETRYVRRSDHYWISYISSQTGCNRLCKFCHLTTTNQTSYRNCTIDELIDQFKATLNHYDNDQIATKGIVHINFMARGEPLANPIIFNNSTELFSKIGELSAERDLIPKFNISTIIPITFKKKLSKAFPLITPTIYYSIYSISKEWRNEWLPSAMPLESALDILAEYQSISKKIIKFHSAFIENENDSDNNIYGIMESIKERKIFGEFNMIRYNPYSIIQGSESKRYKEIFNIISSYMPVKIINRVGEDCHASCGVFYK